MFTLFQKDVANSIHINEIDPMLTDINLIDIREPFEYKHGSIKNSKNIPMGQLLAAPTKYLNKDKKYYIMCQSGGRSSGTVNALSRAGFDVINVKGGFGGYTGKNRL